MYLYLHEQYSLNPESSVTSTYFFFFLESLFYFNSGKDNIEIVMNIILFLCGSAKIVLGTKNKR